MAPCFLHPFAVPLSAAAWLSKRPSDAYLVMLYDQNDCIPLQGIANTAVMTSHANLESTPATDFDWQMAINVCEPFLITQTTAQVISSIVNISLCAAHGGAPFVMASSCSKMALVTFTKSAAELAPKSIHVNVINIVWTITENEHKIQCMEHGAGQDWMAEADASCPMGCILQPPDVGGFFAL